MGNIGKYGMPGELLFFIDGVVSQILYFEATAYVKVPNGNVYLVFPYTPNIEFNRLARGTKVRLEVTTRLEKVYSAKIIE